MVDGRDECDERCGGEWWRNIRHARSWNPTSTAISTNSRPHEASNLQGNDAKKLIKRKGYLRQFESRYEMELGWDVWIQTGTSRFPYLVRRCEVFEGVSTESEIVSFWILDCTGDDDDDDPITEVKGDLVSIESSSRFGFLCPRRLKVRENGPGAEISFCAPAAQVEKYRGVLKIMK